MKNNTSSTRFGMPKNGGGGASGVALDPEEQNYCLNQSSSGAIDEDLDSASVLASRHNSGVGEGGESGERGERGMPIRLFV